MGLLTHGLAAGLGYLLGRPESRAQATRLGRRAADLAHRPKGVKVRDRARRRRPTRPWRSRFSRSGTAHFPSSAEARAAGAEGTTTVEA